MLNIFCLNNFSKKSSPGGVLALGLPLAVYGPGLGPDGPGGPETPEINQLNHLQQFVVLELCPEINPWSCPGSS